MAGHRKDLNAGTIAAWQASWRSPVRYRQVQLQTSREASAGVLRTLRRVVGSEGAAGLYRGLLSPILSNAPINAVVFGVQGQVVRGLQRDDAYCPVPALHGWIQCWTRPSDLRGAFGARQDPASNGAMGAEHSSLVAGRIMLRRYGARTLFKGWQVCLLRDVPAFGAYFCGYEATKRWLTDGESENETDLKLMIGWRHCGDVVVDGEYAQDVVKSCVQSQSLEGKQMTMTQIARSRMQQEGPGFFFKGFSATMLRAFPVSAVTFLVYEKTMQLCLERSKIEAREACDYSAKPWILWNVS
ncbi:Mitochondrial carrier domain [Phytophthora cactorum]|nr:Mitochondrial carrier domain [Phytophthora cactorum]